MRKFFQEQLDGLPSAGIRQVDFLTKEQITKLLDDLCMVSEKNFKYIPPHIQEAEIKKQIIQDADFNGITTRWLFKILTRISEPYWRSRLTEEDLTPAEPVTGERAEYWLNEWKKALDQMQTNFNAAGKGTGARMKDSLDTLAQSRTESPIPVLTEEEIKAGDLHRRYLAAKWKHDQDPRNAGQPFIEEAVWSETIN